MSAALLETRDLSVAFGGIRAVDGVDFLLPANQVRALIGPNGAGKTTFFNAITGWYAPASGRIFFDGAEIGGLPPREIARRGLSRTFQITSIFGELTVYENLWVACQSIAALGRSMTSRAARRDVRQATESMMDRVRLGAERDTRASALSYGDQRVLEIALALARRPKLLLLDEPTAGMSARETEHMVELIRELSADVGIVIVEHDMEVAMGLADVVSVFERGRMIAEGTPAEITANELVQRVYLGTA